jgi:NDP-sugar pyrophosphorylase family protein
VLPTLVLAAGVGARLDPLTREVAKAALPIAGRSLIERTLDWLVREQVTDAVINLHHRPETITAIVGDGRHLGLGVRYSWEPELLGSAGGPRHALPLLDGDDILIVNAEPICDFPLAPLVAAHAASGADVTLAVVPNPAPDRFNGLVADAGGALGEVVPKGAGAAGMWHFVGVQVARRRVFADLPDHVPEETISGIYRPLIASRAGRIRLLAVATHPVHVGTPREYLDAALALGHACCSDAVVEPGVRAVAASAQLRRTVVWPGADVGPDVDLADCVVTGGVRLPRGFAARDAVIVRPDLCRAADRVDRRDGVALFPLGS